ncbi:GRAM domain-containing protein [Radiomyces spectabilis]|uniref:GRAM domain-containing protein n=1 Tax=Radiomyces spectabilis TaxID=64574 RepID=UPI00222036FC|nr:GRAM domain-containing protein [Radiomyces spectabilis]KAI8371345.1 GRAM domain-containing protein [Radiomyces spectabilis]
MDIANAKRNQEFHALFRSVPEDDLLIEDYGCALQKEILLQGRMYISETHVCFNANIFGWVTNLVIAYADIIDIEKRTTAIIIPNAIQISTLQSKHFFASFLSRDQAFDQIVELWRAARQSSRPLINAIDNDTLDIDEDSSPSDNGDKPHPLSRTRTDNAKDDFMPRKHIKTECQCLTGNQHFPHTVMDQTYQGSLETIYNLLYNSGFMKKFLTDVEKNTDITIGQWRKGEGNIKYVRDLSYVKYLGGSIGPKSTKCLLKEEVLHLDLNDYITQLTTTQTPDVPSGSAFCVKTRVCISWAGHEQVRVLVTVLVEFSKSSWLKSTIEKASIDGQLNYYKNLDAAVRKYTGSLSLHHDATGSNNHSRNLAHEATDPSSVVSFATSGLKWIINMILLPNPSQLTMLCMVSMVFINLYIATKMSRVHDRHHHEKLRGSDTKDDHKPHYTADKIYHRMAELERMLKQAGQSLDQMTDMIQQQKQKIIQV